MIKLLLSGAFKPHWVEEEAKQTTVSIPPLPFPEQISSEFWDMTTSTSTNTVHTCQSIFYFLILVSRNENTFKVFFFFLKNLIRK